MELRDIYICDVEDNCTAIPDTEEYKQVKEVFLAAEEKLLSNLNEKQRELFYTYMDAYNDMIGQEEQETYKRALAAGIRITAEAFVLGKENK